MPLSELNLEQNNPQNQFILLISIHHLFPMYQVKTTILATIYQLQMAKFEIGFITTLHNLCSLLYFPTICCVIFYLVVSRVQSSDIGDYGIIGCKCYLQIGRDEWINTSLFVDEDVVLLHPKVPFEFMEDHICLWHNLMIIEWCYYSESIIYNRLKWQLPNC